MAKRWLQEIARGGCIFLDLREVPNKSSEHHHQDDNLQGGLVTTVDNSTAQRLDEQITWYGKLLINAISKKAIDRSIGFGI